LARALICCNSICDTILSFNARLIMDREFDKRFTRLLLVIGETERLTRVLSTIDTGTLVAGPVAGISCLARSQAVSAGTAVYIRQE
jgi:hypothetical protein